VSVKELIQLAQDAANGKERRDKAAIGSNGYGFCFHDFDLADGLLITAGSSKVCPVGSMRNFMRTYNRGLIKTREDFLKFDKHVDIRIAGAMKTLLPTLNFGGDELLFHAWMFVVTPDKDQFPASFYYGPSRLAIGGWNSGRDIWDTQKRFPLELKAAIKCSPHDFSAEQKEMLAEALELALNKVNLSDFFGVFYMDGFYKIMGVQDREPYVIGLSNPWNSFHELFITKTLRLAIDITALKKQLKALRYPFEDESDLESSQRVDGDESIEEDMSEEELDELVKNALEGKLD
jgi:hypothetical protein